MTGRADEGDMVATGDRTEAVPTTEASGVGGSAGNDPEQLVAEIERTREELAGTLDAIAEKVSPKRAAARTGKKLAAAVSEGAEAVKEGATTAKEAVKEGAASAKEAVKEGAATAKDALADKLPEAVAAHLPGGSDHAASPVAGDSGPAATVPHPAASTTSTGYPAYEPGPVPPTSSGNTRKLAAAGVVAVVLGVLVLRRRRR